MLRVSFRFLRTPGRAVSTACLRERVAAETLNEMLMQIYLIVGTNTIEEARENCATNSTSADQWHGLVATGMHPRYLTVILLLVSLRVRLTEGRFITDVFDTWKKARPGFIPPNDIREELPKHLLADVLLRMECVLDPATTEGHGQHQGHRPARFHGVV